ncbi:MAG: hypothetical protein JW822_13060 [Spirochaetales bacterium]|nr:hypothetical protein [Spirochaetales bacterium]
MKKQYLYLLILYVMIIPSDLYAQYATGEQSPMFFDIEPDFIGATLILGFKDLGFFPEVDTIFAIGVGGGYDWFGYYRTPDDEPFDGSVAGFDPESGPVYARAGFKLSLSLTQGLLWNLKEMHNLLELFACLKSHYYLNFDDANTNQLLFAGCLPDREHQLQNSVMVGLEWKDIDYNSPHQLPAGTQAEISLEYGPQWLFNLTVGRSDYLRFNLSTRAFVPLFDLAPDSNLNILSSYLGVFLGLDYAWGKYVPLSIRESMGGKTPRKAVGYAVRGIEDCRFDTPLKIVGNLEIRTNLPAVGSADIIPGITVFLDGAYYDYLDYNESGFVFSAGAGVYLSLFNAFALNFYTAFLLNETRTTGDAWTPLLFAFIFHF